MTKKPLRLLVVDDDELVIDTIKLGLPSHWNVLATQNVEALQDSFFHGALVDIHLSGNLEKSEGLQVMAKLSESFPGLEIIAMSGDLQRKTMESALKAGATRFLAKPLSMEELQLVLEKIEALWQLRGVHLEDSQVRWVGNSPASEAVKKFVASMAGEEAPILVEGPSGSGKEVVARLLHQQDSSRPFVAVNLAAISENLFESEFFGHVKGAFTGAVQNKVGYVEMAHGGYLFLDEVEALSPVHQAKLLRFLESGEYQSVGSQQTQTVKVKVIAASNEPLQEMVEAGQFREDLLYRLSGHRLSLPPLQDRKEDIEELSQHFFSQRGESVRKQLDDDALEKLKAYSWPGNVRQLKRVCERLLLHAPLPVIRDVDVDNILFGERPSIQGQSYSLQKGLAELTNEFEKSVLTYAIDKNDDVEELAKILKISRSSLYKKIKDHGLELKK
ncbi:MAG: sigma-54-dependent Fis family transcriptional regulator [Bdellovibrionales bacterium]|nr:sigma-54-dependent Fis family transcriptional regulator [Bdellovibrionales bacterium]